MSLLLPALLLACVRLCQGGLTAGAGAQQREAQHNTKCIQGRVSIDIDNRHLFWFLT